MARNKIETNVSIFQAFSEFSAKREDDYPLSPKPRWIKSTDLDRNQLKNARRVSDSCLKLTDHVCLDIYHWQDAHYCVISGLDLSSFIEENLTPCEQMDGIATVFLAESGISLLNSKTNIEIYEQFEITEQDGVDFDGFDMVYVISFFPSVSFYKISDIAHLNIYEILGKAILSSFNNVSLQLEKKTIDAIEEMITSDIYPSLSILDGLISHSYENLFMSLYHSLEFNFGRHKIERFKLELGIDVENKVLSKAVESIFGFRYKEEDALSEICEQAKASIDLSELDPSLDSWITLRVFKDIGPKIYKLRNSIVHSRLSSERPQISRNHWNTIIYFLAKIALCLK